MNNIENSIRHLQSSIKKRSEDIRWCHERTIPFNLQHDPSWKEHIKYFVKQQKIEKKMLAMMLSLNRMQYSKNNTVKSTCEYLDNL